MSKKQSITDILHTPYDKPDAYNALNMPVYHSASYEFDSAEEMELAFTGKSSEHTYSRITNPTVQYFEDRIKAITNAHSVTALNSGMAAITNTIITLAKAGDNIVTSSHLFGNTYSFLTSTFAAFGLETRFCDLNSPEEVEKSIDNNTCAVFLEIITNPQLEVVDLKTLSKIAHQHGVPVVADTTVIPFNAFKANKLGIDIEVISSTKYVSGGATTTGGLVIDYASFDWSQSSKLNVLAEKFGNTAFTIKLRKEVHRNMGAYMTPHVAYMQTLGLETLEMRYERSTATCLELTKELEKIPAIKSVNYPGLTSNKYYKISCEQFGERPGAMFTIDLESREACFRFLNKLKLIKRATNLFDNKTLIIHPASTIYGTFTAEQRNVMSVFDTTIRVSVGLEDMEDLLEDFKQALK